MSEYISILKHSGMEIDMNEFTYICDYLGITPKKFFDSSGPRPDRLYRRKRKGTG